MSSLSRLKASPGLLIRALVALGAVAAIAAAVATYASGRAALGADAAEELVVLVIVGALVRRLGIALPGNGFSSYILGVTAYAMLDRGWPFGVLVGPIAMLVGDVALRRLPSAAARDNAAHLAAGGAVAGLVYERLGGATGAPAIATANLPTLVVFLVLLPCVVNATFYLELALGRSLAWVDPRLTARWEAVVYACSAGLALGWLALMHASVDTAAFLVIGAGLAGAPAAAPGGGACPRARAGGRARPRAAGIGSAGAAVPRRAAGRRVERASLGPGDVPRFRRRHAGAPGAATRAHARHRGLGPARRGCVRPDELLHPDPHRHDPADPCVERRGSRLGAAGEPGRRAGRGPGERARPRRDGAGPACRRSRRRGRRDPRVGRADGADDGEDPARHAGGGTPPVRPRRDHGGERARSAPLAGRGGAGREVLRNDRFHREPDEPAGAQRDDRGGPRRRAWPRLRGGGRRGPQARRGKRPRGPERGQVRAGHPASPGPRGAAARAHSRRPGRRRPGLDAPGPGSDAHRRSGLRHGARRQAGRGPGARHPRASGHDRSVARAGEERRPLVHSGSGSRRRRRRRAAPRYRRAGPRRHRAGGAGRPPRQGRALRPR